MDRFDLPRAIALATSVDAMIAAGMTEHARPLTRELLDMLRAADGETSADVISIARRRR